MRYSAVASNSVVTSTFQAGLTEACDRSELSKSLATAWEPINSGASPTRTVTRTGTSATIGHTLILQPLSCGSGGLNLTAPATVTFPPTTLTGFDQTLTATPTFTVDDQRGSGAGWNLSGTSTTFSSGSSTLPTTATRFVSPTPTNGAGFCEAPSNTVVYPVTLPAAAVAPAATKLFNAATDSGLGAVDIVLNTQLAVPAHSRVGTYTSTWTFTLATGP